MGLFGGSFKGGDPIDLAQLQIMAGAPQGQVMGGGLFGGASRAPAPVHGPQPTAAPVGATPTGKGPSFGRVLDGVLGGSTITEVKDHYRAQQAAQAKQQQYLQMVEGLNLSPEEKLIAVNSPEEWMKQRATRSAFHDVTGGNTIVNGPGGAQTVAPKMVSDNGVYGMQDATGYHEQGQRGVSHAEVETARKNDADITKAAEMLGMQKEQLAELIRNHKATEGVAQGNLGMRGREFEARKAAGGFGTPGVGGVLGSTLDPSEWEPVR